jgi:hypothetical protein
MSEWNHWLAVADGLKAAQEAGILSKCTCGAPGRADVMCGHCRLEAAQKALSKLRMHSLAQEKTLELLRDRGKRRVVVRRRLAQSLARTAENPPDGFGEATEQVIEELTDVLSAGAEWQRDALDEAMVEMVKQLGLDCGLWEVDDGPWALASEAEEGQ